MPITQLTFETIRRALVSDSGLTTESSVTTATTGGVTAGTLVLTVASATGYSAGHGIQIAGAGVGGGKLATWIESIDGVEFTIHDKAVNTVSSAAVTHDNRAVVPANNILPAAGNFPSVFPAVAMRLEGATEEFSKTLSGDLWLYVYYQSESGTTGQPMTILNIICDRIRDLLHKEEDGISNNAIRIQKLRERYKGGVVPEIDISETTHSQALRYEYMSIVA